MSFSAPASLSCKFSLYYPCKISSLLMRIKQIITQHFSKVKNKVLPICLQGNYRDSLGEFSNMLYRTACLELRGLNGG